MYIIEVVKGVFALKTPLGYAETTDRKKATLFGTATEAQTAFNFLKKERLKETNSPP